MVRLTVQESADDREAQTVWPVYAAVFDDYPDHDTWRDAVWDRHVAREGFRLACATGGEELVGFAYGYVGQRGQWWTDEAARVLAPEVGEAWLGGHFELVSLAAVPAARGRGVGRALMRTLLAGVPQDRLLLMATADPADPARRLYASEGWHVVGPGIGEGKVILGRRVTPGTSEAEPPVEQVDDRPRPV